MWTFESKMWTPFQLDPVRNTAGLVTCSGNRQLIIQSHTWMSFMFRKPTFFTTFTLDIAFPYRKSSISIKLYSRLDYHTITYTFRDGYIRTCLYKCSWWTWSWWFYSQRPPEVLIFYHRSCNGVTLDGVTLWDVTFYGGHWNSLVKNENTVISFLVYIDFLAVPFELLGCLGH